MRLPALIAAVLTIAPAAGFAQSGPERFSGRTVSAVRLFVEDRPLTDPLISDLVETRVGQPLSVAAVRETITHIYSLGRFQDIQVEAADAADGAVELSYTLIPIHAVDSVEFRGSLGLPEGLLRDAIKERFGRTPELGRAGEATRTLRRLYEDRGYFNPTIRMESRELHDPDRTMLTFQIHSGPRARIRRVEVTGEPPASREALLAELGLQSGEPYQRVQLNDRLARYVERLKKQRRLQATANHVHRLADDGAAADVTLDVRPGPIVTVAFEGDPLPAARRNELVPIEREGSVDEDLLEDSVARIEAYLRQQGFWRADATFAPRQADDRLTIVFTVKRGTLYRVARDGVVVSGNAAVPSQELRPLIPLAPGDPYVASFLDAASSAIRLLYHTRGYAWAEITTQEEESSTEPGTVRPRIIVVEGPRATIDRITVTGVAAVGESEIRRLTQLKIGMPFYEPAVRAARDAVELEYLNLGFTAAQVTVDRSISEDRTRVDLTIAVNEGTQTIVDHIIVVGNQRTAENVIRRELVLRPGAPLGLRDLLESRRRLSALGLFRRFDIRELPHGAPSRRDVLVTVEEAPATTIGYGGGLELTRIRGLAPTGEAEERIDLAPRGFFDIGRRNLGGKNRSVSLFTRASIRRSSSSDPSEDGSGFEFSEYRLVGTYREPRALTWNADFTLTGAVEQGIRSSFNFTRRGVTSDLVRRITPALRTSVRYTLSATRTFDVRLSEDEQALIDRRFPRVRLSVVSGALSLDRRDDVVDPTRGTFLSAEASMASRATGGEVGFIKTYFQGHWFRRVRGTSRVVLATRAAIGLADGFEREVPGADGGPPDIIEDLPASERFFAGGDSTIRGYAVDTVGAPETISPSGFPRGGNAVLILNGELRVPLWKDFGAAFFIDGGNVFERVTQFDIGELRGGAGLGVRYRSPIGPIRLDLGFKMDRRVLGSKLEPRAVLHFSIGQAF